MLDIITVAALLAISGFIGKIADGHVDNNTEFGKKYTHIFSFAWAAIWCVLFVFSHNLYIVLVSIVFFWIYKTKFDAPTHGTCLITFIVGVIYYNNAYHAEIFNFGIIKSIVLILILFLLYTLLYRLKRCNKPLAFSVSLFTPCLFAVYSSDAMAALTPFFFAGTLVAMRLFGMKQKSFFFEHQDGQRK